MKISLVFAEIFGGICQYLPSFFLQLLQNSQTPFLNSKVTEMIFTTFLHDVEALVLLLMHPFAKRCCILFRNARSMSEGDFN